MLLTAAVRQRRAPGAGEICIDVNHCACAPWVITPIWQAECQWRTLIFRASRSLQELTMSNTH